MKNMSKMSKMYTGAEYFKNNPCWGVTHSPWKANQIMKMLRKNNLTNIKSICDVGCGAGEIINQLSLQMLPETNFFGYEISPDAYAICLKIKNHRLTYYLQDILQDDRVFYDVVMAIDIIEHIEDYMGFLRKLREKAEWKIFHIPLEINVVTALRPKSLIAGRKMVGHLHYFSKETALATLQDTGYEIIDVFYTPAAIDIARTLRAKMLKIPRNLMFLLNQDLAVKTLGGFSLLVLAK